ncbi:MAG: hypothetical protein V4592_04770 [Bacteroidota bacterium]
MNNREISLMWVSLAARDAWHNTFADLRKVMIVTTLSGVHSGQWQSRSLNLYGNSWMVFLSMVKNYNVSYTSQVVHHRSAPARMCHSVYITHNDFAAVNGPTASRPAAEITFWDIAQGSSVSLFKTETLIEYVQTPMSLLLWEDIGLSLFADIPSGLSCNECCNIVESHLNWMDACGYGSDAETLREILSWPVEWSSFHGIEELRTPLFKLQATNWAKIYHPKHTVQIMGDGYPAEGAVGLNFPYQQKAFKSVSSSASFKNGVLHNACSK